MRIAVCLKRVPDTTTKIVIGPDGKSIDENGVKFVPNPYDEYALGGGAQAQGGRRRRGNVVVYSLGGDAAQETIRTALAMGIDRGVLLQTAPARPTAWRSRGRSRPSSRAAATT